MDSEKVEDGSTNLPLLAGTQAYLRLLVEESDTSSVVATAWDEFYRVYSQFIRRFVVSCGVHGADADDVIQEVWSEVATRLKDFKHPGDRPRLRPWLYTLVRGKATNYFRQRARDPAKYNLGDAIREGQEPIDAAPQPPDQYEMEWEQSLAKTLVEEMRSEVSASNYRLLQMRVLEGREVADVAAELKVTPERVRYRQHRLLKKLKARVAVFTGEPLGKSG